MKKAFQTKKGFTLIELLSVMLIIGLIVAYTMTNVSSAKGKSRDAWRKATLKQIQIALEFYREKNATGLYPVTGNGVWYSSETGDAYSNGPSNNGEWIPGLAPSYIGVLPKDPVGGNSSLCNGYKRAFLYRSNDGSGYDLLSHCAPESEWTSSDPFYDSNRPTTAWEVCVGADCSDT